MFEQSNSRVRLTRVGMEKLVESCQIMAENKQVKMESSLNLDDCLLEQHASTNESFRLLEHSFKSGKPKLADDASVGTEWETLSYARLQHQLAMAHAQITSLKEELTTSRRVQDALEAKAKRYADKYKSLERKFKSIQEENRGLRRKLERSKSAAAAAKQEAEAIELHQLEQADFGANSVSLSNQETLVPRKSRLEPVEIQQEAPQPELNLLSSNSDAEPDSPKSLDPERRRLSQRYNIDLTATTTPTNPPQRTMSAKSKSFTSVASSGKNHEYYTEDDEKHTTAKQQRSLRKQATSIFTGAAYALDKKASKLKSKKLRPNFLRRRSDDGAIVGDEVYTETVIESPRNVFKKSISLYNLNATEQKLSKRWKLGMNEYEHRTSSRAKST